MSIYDILASKPHNPHYLKRYIKFIEHCQNKNDVLAGYTENHHILPKAYFPQYKNFKTHHWNKATLTARQHFIAHWILARAFGNEMWHAFHIMTICKTANQERYVIKNGRIYEEIRKNRKMSETTKIKISKASQNRTFSDETRRRISDGNRGKLVSEETRRKLSKLGVKNSAKKSEKMSKKLWYNDGKINRRIDPETDNTGGWTAGRIKLTRKSGWELRGKNNPASKTVCAAGMIFETVTAAARYHKISRVNVSNKCKSPDFDDWYYMS